MLYPTPFHPRTAPLCETHEWREWAGYMVAAAYTHAFEYEYYAIRNSAALIDVSPLFKYDFKGSEAARAVNRIVTRDIERCRIGQVMYTCWCDDDGKVIDDGTVTRLAEDHFRITAAESNLVWFEDCSFGLDVRIADVSEELAALAVQGPASRKILDNVIKDINLSSLRYYRAAPARIGKVDVIISRTGYTGDLGYELWISAEQAVLVWDRIIDSPFGTWVTPAGMLALDLARIEAGLILIQVDYISTRKALTDEEKSSPFEIGLGWAVDFTKGNFVGRRQLLNEANKGSRYFLAGLIIDWHDLENEYGRFDLVPQVAGRASRSPVPVYRSRDQVGYVTSQAFSPILKKYIAIGSFLREKTKPGDFVEVEITVEFQRRLVRAQIVGLPFFNPARKRN